MREYERDVTYDLCNFFGSFIFYFAMTISLCSFRSINIWMNMRRKVKIKKRMSVVKRNVRRKKLNNFQKSYWSTRKSDK
uniref:Uncharacterized protein n=1 Tax=Solanum tuberosum TaxID=4113 RepID=M1CXG2_SOLTU